MKKNWFLFLVFVSLCLLSCNDNDKNNPQHDVGQGVVVLKDSQGIPFNGYITFNFEAKQMISTSPAVQFVNFGEVNALKEVILSPSDERWSKASIMTIDIKEGCGYVARYRHETGEEYSYIRLYIKEYYNDQGIKGYWVQYEDNWIPQEL